MTTKDILAKANKLLNKDISIYEINDLKRVIKELMEKCSEYKNDIEIIQAEGFSSVNRLLGEVKACQEIIPTLRQENQKLKEENEKLKFAYELAVSKIGPEIVTSFADTAAPENLKEIKLHRDGIEDILDDFWRVLNKTGDCFSLEAQAELNIWQSKKAIEINRLIQQAKNETNEIIIDLLLQFAYRGKDKKGNYIHDGGISALERAFDYLGYGERKYIGE